MSLWCYPHSKYHRNWTERSLWWLLPWLPDTSYSYLERENLKWASASYHTHMWACVDILIQTTTSSVSLAGLWMSLQPHQLGWRSSTFPGGLAEGLLSIASAQSQGCGWSKTQASVVVIDAQSQGCDWSTRGVWFKHPFLSCARRVLGLSDPVAGRLPSWAASPSCCNISPQKKKKRPWSGFSCCLDWPGNTREVAAGAAESRGNSTGHRTGEAGTAACRQALLWTEQGSWWVGEHPGQEGEGAGKAKDTGEKTQISHQFHLQQWGNTFPRSGQLWTKEAGAFQFILENQRVYCASQGIWPVSLCLLLGELRLLILGVTIESLLLLFCCFLNLFWFRLYIPCSLLLCLLFTLEHGIPSNNHCRASSASISALNSFVLCNFSLSFD